VKPAESLSQWQLIRLRFLKHKLAVLSLLLLVCLYGIAALAELVAPYGADEMNLDAIYCPPQVPKFSFSKGLYVHPLVRQIDPESLKSSYYEDAETIVPLGLFVRSEAVKLWGLIPVEHRLLGIDVEAFNRLYPDSNNKREAPTFFLLGSDKFGRDLFSRIVHGSRISLSIGLISIAITFVLGLLIGGISGYLGGIADTLIQRAIEIINSFPSLPLWMTLAAVMPADWGPLKVFFMITVVLSLIGWTGLARVVRGKILSLREEDYAVAARLLGASHGRIIFKHLVPGFTSHIVVSLTLAIPGMILGETTLSFLGLGLRPPVVSWGVMLQDCMNLGAIADYPWLLMPVVTIVLTVLSFNFLGDGIRDAADPYSSR
jgi:peptide/nickel transport system permease protein